MDVAIALAEGTTADQIEGASKFCDGPNKLCQDAIELAPVAITRFGRYVYAMGGNPEAAELAGIDVKKMTLLIFVISGILCAIAGAVSIARLNASPTSLGQHLSRP